MIDIIIKGQLAATVLPELVPILIQALVPQIGLEFTIETKHHVDSKVKGEVK